MLPKAVSNSTDKNSFPYWTKHFEMEDPITANFCSIDRKKNKLTVATENVDFKGDADTGWDLTIDNSKPIPFNFLNKLRKENRIAYVFISYLTKS